MFEKTLKLKEPFKLCSTRLNNDDKSMISIRILECMRLVVFYLSGLLSLNGNDVLQREISLSCNSENSERSNKVFL